jgi:uncharacterized protein with NAD-binding domain and iron-sulfur cluster
MHINNMHPTAFPASVTATDYEPVAETKGLNIYLLGQKGDQKFYYRFSMEGSEKTGYRVASVWRHEAPPPGTLSRWNVEELLSCGQALDADVTYSNGAPTDL